jgi:hypothetical protein
MMKGQTTPRGVIGGLIGVFFGLAFGGNHKWKVWDYIFGPAEPGELDDEGADHTEGGQPGSQYGGSEKWPRNEKVWSTTPSPKGGVR